MGAPPPPLGKRLLNNRLSLKCYGMFAGAAASAAVAAAVVAREGFPDFHMMALLALLLLMFRCVRVCVPKYRPARSRYYNCVFNESFYLT